MTGSWTDQRGFTLIEALVVIAIVGIVMAIATPATQTWRENAQIRSSARAVANMIQEARSRAIRGGDMSGTQAVVSFKVKCDPGVSPPKCDLIPVTLANTLTDNVPDSTYAFPVPVDMRTDTDTTTLPLCDKSDPMELEFFSNGSAEVKPSGADPRVVCIMKDDEVRFMVDLTSLTTGKVKIVRP